MANPTPSTPSAKQYPLSRLAARARGGEPNARNILWDILQPQINSAVSRQRSLPRLWDRDDLQQEAFIVFASVCDGWQGKDFLAYFEREFPAELYRCVRRAWRKQMRELALQDPPDSGQDPRSTDTYRLTELLESLDRLPAQVNLALRLHLLYGMPLAQVGRQLGLGRRALGGLLPQARHAAEGGIETEQERLDRLVRELFVFADSTGRLHADSREIRARLKLSPRQYRAFIGLLSESGVLRGRSRGHPGRLPAGGPESALRRIRGFQATRGIRAPNPNRTSGK